MKVVFIAPLPPPLTGNSLAAKVFYDELLKSHEVELINLNKESFKSGAGSFGRLKQIFSILLKVIKEQKKADIIYFSISESTMGNIKDLLIYLLCFKKLEKTFVHMLGGAGMKSILEKKGIQYRLNRFFMSRLSGIIVEGWPQASTFSQIIDKNKIHIVPNFAEDFLFITEAQVRNKYEKINPLKILFLSNLLYGKGQNELVDGYLSLDKDLRDNVKITFIGGFESDIEKQKFLKKIEGQSGLLYHSAFVSGEEKKSFYYSSHVFCLPTYYPYEGQPISILEAYATGCVVIVTEHSGIPQIFKDALNGFAVEKQSGESIRKTIENICKNKDILMPIGLTNRNTAFERYRTSIYGSALLKIINNANQN